MRHGAGCAFSLTSCDRGARIHNRSGCGSDKLPSLQCTDMACCGYDLACACDCDVFSSKKAHTVATRMRMQHAHGRQCSSFRSKMETQTSAGHQYSKWQQCISLHSCKPLQPLTLCHSSLPRKARLQAAATPLHCTACAQRCSKSCCSRAKASCRCATYCWTCRLCAGWRALHLLESSCLGWRQLQTFRPVHLLHASLVPSNQPRSRAIQRLSTRHSRLPEATVA